MIIVTSLLCTAAVMVATSLAGGPTRRPAAPLLPGLLWAAGAWSAGLLLWDLWHRGAVTVASAATILTVGAAATIWLRYAADSPQAVVDDFQLWERELDSPEVSEE
ncbi:hypothetical protein [Brachybacterium sp. ACRRE]|uniref:hypothetical protein n=1 Tax=Brachybacterium sp. ACRRE TaxID=2918184 RepID=UPI001EF3BBFD|nr:hypothetical protein [Brachybacterium sp. ACRRE]MCG7308495.1 hypothetical protein [Brachybacterium sp. ACRRE]